MSKSAFGQQYDSPTAWQRFYGRFVEWIGPQLFGRPKVGAITFVFPNGHTRTMGRPGTGFHPTLRFRNFRVLGAVVRRGTLGFAECYINGDVEIDDLTALFRMFLQNQERLGPGKIGAAAQDLAYHLSRANTREMSPQNISEHYDLGNDFYGEWLDSSMTYSSALFSSADQSLEAAQLAKYRRVAEMAGVRPGHSILEIGCGWGGFAETAARDFGADVRGITLSREQLAFAQERMRRQGLDGRVELVFEDYRDTIGQFDHIASIEMIEAVGEEHWPQYFRTVHDRLKPGGTAAIQAITIREQDFEDYKRNPDFIQRYIFPGGMLLTETAMRDEAARAGLVLESSERFRKSYARTLRLWRDRFLERWDAIAPLGYDEPFRRKWLYYLAYCEAGFEEGRIDVGIYRYRRPA